jgi:hypothetical protein
MVVEHSEATKTAQARKAPIHFIGLNYQFHHRAELSIPLTGDQRIRGDVRSWHNADIKRMLIELNEMSAFDPKRTWELFYFLSGSPPDQESRHG